MIDLHFHSTFSDGSFSPEELVEMGVQKGLTAMALTDHDSMRGVARFMEAAESKGIRCISGCELSVDVPGIGVHVLAYGCDTENNELLVALENIRKGRHRRNVEMLSRLTKLGCPISWKSVLDCAGDDDLVARPHFAQALIKQGYARSKDDAFKRYLTKGAPAYAERFRLAPEEAIRLIHGAGGVAVLAHPSRCGFISPREVYPLIQDLVAVGLDGIEVYYTGHSIADINVFTEFAHEFDLVATGGSDFHGEMSPNVEIGIAYGGLNVPDVCFDNLRERIPSIDN